MTYLLIYKEAFFWSGMGFNPVMTLIEMEEHPRRKMFPSESKTSVTY
jgi:hypothetical protein